MITSHGPDAGMIMRSTDLLGAVIKLRHVAASQDLEQEFPLNHQTVVAAGLTSWAISPGSSNRVVTKRSDG